MRSNVKKMWTALLAVLFAAAVGFGLWFAFAPAARPANVHAAEGYSLTLKSKQEGQTLSSNSSINSDLLYNESHGKGFIDVTIYRDGTAISSSEYITTMKFYVYSDEACKNQVDDFRPLSNETGSTFHRYVKISIEVVGLGEITSNNSVMLTVTSETLDAIEAEVIGGKYFDALTSFEDIADKRLEVLAYYEGDRKGYPLEYAGVYEGEVKENKACYGGYWIEYHDDPDDENDRTDCLEYGDTQITIWYREGNSEPKPFVLNNLTVNEAYIDAPTTADSFEGEVTYDGSEHTFSFTQFNSAEMSYSVTYEPNVGDQAEETGTEEDSSISIKKTEAGSYAVKFSVKEGYQFRSPSIPEEDIEKDDDDKIIGVTYHFKIEKASITGVEIEFPERWKYSETPTLPQYNSIALTTDPSITGLNAASDSVRAKVTFNYTDTAGYNSTTLPENAGKYTWTVSLTGMNNFEDFTGTDANGGSGSFVIEKKTLSVPALTSAELAYTGEAQSATAASTSKLYSFSSDSGTNVTAEGYEATFTLTDPDNYKWADGADVSGNKDEIATVTWKIVQAENKATVSLEDWTYGETAKSPSVTADFGAETVTYSYSGQTNAGVTYSGDTAPTEAGKYTVKATIAGTKNYKGATATDTFEVLRAPIGLPSFTTSTFSYNGQNQTPEFSAAVSGFTHDLAEKKDAGSYTVTATPDGNHQWNTANASGLYVYNYELKWTISPAEIGVEGDLSIEGWTYGGYDESANEPGGVELNDETSALLGTATATFKYEYKLSSEGSAYTTSVPTDAGNYTVRLTISVNKNFKDYTATANFTIGKDELTFGDATGVLGWTWGDITIPGHNGLIPDATYGTNEGEKVSSFTYTYYKAENDAISGVALAEKPSDAGNYILRVSVSEGDNYKAGSKDYSFTVEKGQAEVRIEIEKDNWTYLDDPQSHLISVTVIVGDKKLESSSYTVTYYTRGWNASGEWTGLGTLNSKTFDDGSTSYLLPIGYSAGYYYIGVGVADTDNYTGTSLGEDDTENRFTIRKKQISIPALLGDENTPSQREFEHDGNAKSPTINGEWSGATVTQSGYFKSDFSKLDSAPVEFGDYFVRFTLSDTQNYEWVIIASDQLPQTGEVKHIDTISGENNEYLYVAFRITGSLYSISVSHEGWKIGSGSVPVPSVTAAEGSEDALNSALALGVTVTFTYYFVENGTETEVVTVTANNGTTMLGFVPVEVALKAGTYKVRVDISASYNQSYAARTALSAPFTVSPYELQKGDVNWTVPSGPIYKGTEYTFGGAGSNIYATYKTWSYANGVYSATENGDYLTLALTGEAEEILNAGKYTLSASLPENEHAVALPTDAEYAKKPITVSPKEINVTLEEYSETYKGETFSGSFTTNGRSHNGQTLFTIGENRLYGSDTLEGKFTYPENAINAGIYAWGGIAWSNDNYLVTVTNEKEEVFTIDPAPITVAIKPQTSIYGEKTVDLTVANNKDTSTDLYSIEGTLYDNADTIFTLQAQKDDGTPLQKGDDARDYKIVGSTTGEGLINSGNYNVTFEGGGKAYSITARELKVVLNDFEAVYGTKETTETLKNHVTFSYNGSETVFVSEDDRVAALEALSFTVGDGSYAENSAAGSTWTVTPDVDPVQNYTFTVQSGTMTVKPRPITVEISDVSVTYGTAGTLGVNSVSYTGGGSSEAVISSDLAGGDGAEKYANVFTLALYENNSGTLGEPIDPNDYGSLNRGEYLISLTKVSENYEITFEDATYTVNAQSIDVILVLDTSGHEGSSPVFDGLAWKYLAYGSDESEVSIEEIIFHVTYYHALQDVRGDKLNGAPVNAGSYYAVVDTVLDEDGNYIAGGSFSVSFTIAQRKVDVEWLVDDVEASGYSLGYNGDTGYSITARYYGWTDGNQNAEPTLLDVPKPSDFRNVKDYDFTAAFATDAEKGNYKFGEKDDEDSVTQTFSIMQAPITVAIKPQTSIYGEDIVSLEVPADMADENSLYTIEGEIFDNADTIFSLSTTATNTSDAQSYQITGKASGLLNSGNYKVTFVSETDSGRNYGTYTITRRPVVINLKDFKMIYGTDISAVDNHEKLVSLSVLNFTLGTGTTGSPFLTKDSGAEAAAKSAMNFVFTGSGAYGEQSDANTTWTVTASLSDQASDDLKNYTFVADTSTMKVIPRPIKVTLPELGSTSYTYGTAALQKAFLTFKASVSIDDKWADYGEPIVFNDNAEGGVYTLVVKNEDGGVTTLSASTPVGTYTLAGKEGGDSNYSVTFTTEQTFSVTEAEFKVNAEDSVSVSVVYTGKNYYFRSDAANQQDPADTYLFGYSLNVTTADFVLSEKDIAFTWGFKVGGNSLTCLTNAGTYEVNYTVTAENFETVTGSFTVTISKATNKWTAGMTTEDGGAYKQASWTYGDPEKYSSLNWTDTFTGYTPSTPFEAAFGEVQIEYYKTRTEGSGSYTYSDKINDPGTFFGCETAVGTYYVKVFVEATDNFTGLTAHGTIVVSQRALDIDWAANNITVDGETHEGQNTTIGFDNTLMTVDTESLPQGLTIVDGPSATGEITVNVKAEGTTQFYLYFELIDPDNYCWQKSATVSGDKDERIQINFTTNALQNNVTFKGQDGDPSQNTGISITFGTELRYKFAASSGDTIGDAHLLIFADSTLADETQNYYISFARTTQEDEGPKNDIYSISSLEGADAGYYWLRVQVYPTSDSSYGYGIGYLKICVTQQEITQDDIAGIDFGLSEGKLHFTYDGQEHQPSAEDVPSYLHVTFSGSATNVCEGEVTVTATFTIADDNYKFADDVSPTREITVVIDPYEITHIVWSDREYTYNGTDQTEDVYAYFVDVFGVEHRLCVTAEGGFISVTADGTTFTALLELYGEQEDFCIQNYKFAEGLAELTHVYKMAKATVEIGIGDAEAVYTGEPIEIDQTQYALRTAISLSDSELLDFLEQIRLIAVDDKGEEAVNVGSYKIILEEKEWAYTNIEIVFNDSYAGQLTVSPAPLEVPVLDETQFVYNGSVQKPNVTGKDGVYTVANVGGTDVGDYYVTLTLETDNYRWETTGEKFVKLKYEIVQAEYSFSFDVSNTVYNGAPVSVNAPELPSGEDEASVTYYYTGTTNAGEQYSGSEAPTEAGSYTVRVTISGMKNYKDAEESTEFTIGRAPIEVSITFKQQVEGVSGWVNGWVYGTAPEDIYDLVDGSNPGGGKETATYSTGSWSGSAIPAEVGEYTLTVTVAETANYKSGSAKVEFEIVQASEDELSFTVSIEGWTYGEEPHAPSVIWGGGLTGHPDQISPVYTYAKAKADGETYSDKDFSSTVPTNAGSYVVKATFAETDHYGKLSAMCQFTIEKATALIDTSGMQKSFTYNGRAQALSGAVLNHSETTLSYSPATVTAVGSYTVTISAKESENYTAATATVTVTVSRASAGFSVRIDDWTYGETPSRYTISGGSGGSVTVTYSGTTNAGVKYSSSKVPTEAGEYTITVVMSASGNFLGGTARDSFTIHRADAGAELTLAGWAYGETPNSYILTPEFLRDEVIRAVYSDGTYFSEAVPQDVGSYTLTVTYGETDNYLGGEVSCKFSITRYDLGLSVSIEGWTYGDEPNKPVVTGADIVGLTLSYTGTANDGTTWSSNTAPEKAGSYTLTVTVTKAGSYTGESASVAFTIARRLLTLPAWNEEGVRELTEVYGGERMMRSILGFDMALMNVQSETAQFMFNGSGAASVTANIHGVYTIVVSLKDAANYGWADLNEGETLTGPVTLTWTLTERVISLLWLIILLVVLIVIALIVLIVLLKKGGKPDGTDTGKSDVRLSSVAPVGLLLVVAPLGEIIAVVVLGVVLAAVVIANIAVGVRNAKRAKAAENAQEPVPAYGDEAAAEGEAYLGTEVPADDGAEVAPDEGGMLQ